VSTETIETLLLLAWEPLSRPAVFMLLLLGVYNLSSLFMVHRIRLDQPAVRALLALDLLFVTIVSYHTGGSQSPFLGQCYLVIFAAALCYGFVGGMLAGAASIVITLALVVTHPAGLWEDLRDFIPYFLVAGAFTGFLAERMRLWFHQYQESERRKHEIEVRELVARQEMELARVIQTAALSAIPAVPQLDIAARLQFAREVGGDFYLVLEQHEKIGLVIGDVTGKGLPAALTATSINHLLPWLDPLRDARRALCQLNQDLVQRLPAGAFVTLTLVEADLGARSLRVWNAGHPPALLYRTASKGVVETQIFNPLLGVLPSWTGQPERWSLEPGDVLVLYSDGLLETRNTAGELFGTVRIAQVLAENISSSADQIAEALVQAATQWGAVTDDLTVVVCKRIAADLSPSQVIHSRCESR
jgi:hypothetical protein